MVSYTWAGRSQKKFWWRPAAILTCKSIVKPEYRGERLIELSSSWFPPKFPLARRAACASAQVGSRVPAVVFSKTPWGMCRRKVRLKSSFGTYGMGHEIFLVGSAKTPSNCGDLLKQARAVEGLV